jgi:hypothetical protein
LYLRQVKQVLRTADESFDERRYGFAGLVEALRYCQREGLFRLDRDRQGVLRVYPGVKLQRVAPLPESIDGADLAPPQTEPATEPRAGDLFAADASVPVAGAESVVKPEPSVEASPAKAAADVAGPAPEPEVEVARIPRRRSAAKKAHAAPAPRKNATPSGRGRTKTAGGSRGRRPRKPENPAD